MHRDWDEEESSYTVIELRAEVARLTTQRNAYWCDLVRAEANLAALKALVDDAYEASNALYSVVSPDSNIGLHSLPRELWPHANTLGIINRCLFKAREIV